MGTEPTSASRYSEQFDSNQISGASQFQYGPTLSCIPTLGISLAHRDAATRRTYPHAADVPLLCGETAADPHSHHLPACEIGRASCRETAEACVAAVEVNAGP